MAPIRPPFPVLVRNLIIHLVGHEQHFEQSHKRKTYPASNKIQEYSFFGHDDSSRMGW